MQSALYDRWFGGLTPSQQWALRRTPGGIIQGVDTLKRGNMESNMSSDELQLGDLVTLNSGGPAMVINGMKDGMIECVWFDKKKAKEMNVPAECLTRCLVVKQNA
jgi:uncharacterized protein YodC (DUF2158 family)